MSKGESKCPNRTGFHIEENLNCIEQEPSLKTESQIHSKPSIIIKVCMGSSCFIRGNAENLAYIEKFIKNNNLDAQVELIGQRCENNCSTGPNIMINNKTYNNVNLQQLEKALLELTLIPH